EPLTTYYWKVVAKGDPFCDFFSAAESPVQSFTTAGSCLAPGAFQTDAVAAAASVQLTWSSAARAAAYDVAIGTSSPPQPFASGLTATALTVAPLAPGTTYYWSVTAHADCDAAATTSSEVRSFATLGSCASPLPVSLASPSDGDSTVAATPTLTWNASAGTAAYDLYFGGGPNPPLYLADIARTSA